MENSFDSINFVLCWFSLLHMLAIYCRLLQYSKTYVPSVQSCAWRVSRMTNELNNFCTFIIVRKNHKATIYFHPSLV
ncbi:unnamed protein product [Chironomus riparius]|uniref:Uncharacterized protein n=1 Tax=Chironomus riparius TaxID=315576 RepID=A0A9N9S7X5_9DIPT|nr:unnamed protein product [Chironomus riparius]